MSEPSETFHHTVDVFLDWRDRLRALCGRPIHVRVTHAVRLRGGVIVGEQAVSSANVSPIRRRQPTGGYEAVGCPVDAPAPPAEEVT